jgi:hypothetical protein
VGSENTSKLDMTENEGLEDEKVRKPIPLQRLKDVTDSLYRNTSIIALLVTLSILASGRPNPASQATVNSWRAYWRDAMV